MTKSFIKNLFAMLVAASITVNASQSSFQSASSSSSDTCLSCSGCSKDPCVTNTPGGLLLLTSFWDYDPATGPQDSWTIHGLWPDNCDGSIGCNGNRNRANNDIGRVLLQHNATDVLDYMNEFWLNIGGNQRRFWSHEWNKHGTCVNTLAPQCYNHFKPGQDIVDFFRTTTTLFDQHSTFKALESAGIVPSNEKTYKLADLQAAVSSVYNHEIVWKCKNGKYLNAAWYFFHTSGKSSSDGFVLIDPIPGKSTCPETGIFYKPK